VTTLTRLISMFSPKCTEKSFVAGRFLCGVVAGVILLCVGCATVSKPMGELQLPFGRHSRDESLRKQVEHDSFPTAEQAGL